MSFGRPALSSRWASRSLRNVTTPDCRAPSSSTIRSCSRCIPSYRSTSAAPPTYGRTISTPRSSSTNGRRSSSRNCWSANWAPRPPTISPKEIDSPIDDRAIVGVVFLAVLPVVIDLAGQRVLVQLDPQPRSRRQIEIALAHGERLFEIALAERDLLL